MANNHQGVVDVSDNEQGRNENGKDCVTDGYTLVKISDLSLSNLEPHDQTCESDTHCIENVDAESGNVMLSPEATSFTSTATLHITPDSHTLPQNVTNGRSLDEKLDGDRDTMIAQGAPVWMAVGLTDAIRRAGKSLGSRKKSSESNIT